MWIEQEYLMLGEAQDQREHPFSIDVKGRELYTRWELFICQVDYVFSCRIVINDKGEYCWNYCH